MVLYINACVRKESRTNRIVECLLEKLGGEYEEVKLSERSLKPLSEEMLIKRTQLMEKGLFSDPMFDLARQFQQAEQIVIAAPFWDLSFPSILKIYMENIYVIGLVSEYGADGTPHGLCRAEKLYYVTTAGGAYVPDFSYDYIRSLSCDYFGIRKTELIMAEMLDVVGYDEETIVEQKIKDIQERGNA